MKHSNAVQELRKVLDAVETDEELRNMAGAKDEVLARFQPLFSVENLPNLSEEDFQSFLLSDNNRHWSGIHRHGPRMCADMPRLREAITYLHDEEVPIAKRYDDVISSVTGMGKAVVTALLQIINPDAYGIWNKTSEAGMKALDVWPHFERGMSWGQKYEQINQELHRLKDTLNIDHWLLDGLWWRVVKSADDNREPQDKLEKQKFWLENQLHEFLRDNWNATSLGRAWMLYSEPNDDEAGYKFSCGVGEIDLLARHRTKSHWLVIELKKGQTGDATVGQVLRYMGWVREHEVKEPRERVFGLIIAQSVDAKSFYALTNLENVTVQLYEVDFRLRPPSREIEELPFEVPSLDDLLAKS